VRTMTISSPRRSPRLPSRPAAITALQLAYLAWAAVTLARGELSDAIALVVVFAVLQVPRLLRLPVAFDVAFLVAWTLQELGQVAGFWSRFPWWDTLVHTALLVFLVAAGFGSAYEIYEWTSDSHRGTHYQPDNNDTMTDTTANAVGGLAGGVLLVAATRRRRRPR